MSLTHQVNIIEKANQAIKERLQDVHFSLHDLCREVGYSYSHLHYIIKTETGLTLAYYVRRQRLVVAEKLLLNTDMHIAQICFSVGFKDPSYFARVFRQEYGKSPTEMRDIHK